MLGIIFKPIFEYAQSLIFILFRNSDAAIPRPDRNGVCFFIQFCQPIEFLLVILSAGIDLRRAVDLLKEHHTRELMRKGHRAH